MKYPLILVVLFLFNSCWHDNNLNQKNILNISDSNQKVDTNNYCYDVLTTTKGRNVSHFNDSVSIQVPNYLILDTSESLFPVRYVSKSIVLTISKYYNSGFVLSSEINHMINKIRANNTHSFFLRIVSSDYGLIEYITPLEGRGNRVFYDCIKYLYEKPWLYICTYNELTCFDRENNVHARQIIDSFQIKNKK